MSRNSRKRKFYPEFYSDEEYAEKNKTIHTDEKEEKNESEQFSTEIQANIKSADESMSKKFDALKPAQVFESNPELMKKIENIKDDFIKQQAKIKTRSFQNPMSRVETQEDYSEEEKPLKKTIFDTFGGETVNGANEMKESELKTMNHDEYEKSESELDIIDGEDLLKIHNMEDIENAVEELTALESEELMSMESEELISMESEKLTDTEEVFYQEPLPYVQMPTENLKEEKQEKADIKFEPAPVVPQFEEPVSPMPQIKGIKPYNRENAVKYAKRWALDRNPEYYNFEEIGGDCTNYASQIILAGGCTMNYTPTFGWYYSGTNDRAPSWTDADYLFNFLTSDHSKGPVGKEVDMSEIEAGDIVQLSFNGKTFQHSPVIVKIKKDENREIHYNGIFVCAHTFDCENRPLDTYNWRKIRFIKILGTK